MRINSLKSILAGIIIAVLAMTAAPVIANAAMGNMTSHCDANPSPEKAAIPSCCLESDCPMFSLSNAVDKQVILFSPPAGNDVRVSFNAITDSDSTSACRKPTPHDPTTELPSPLNIKYQCRNSLNSDDPFSL